MPPPESSSLTTAAVPKPLPLIRVQGTPPESTANLTAQEFCDSIKQADLDLEVDRYEKALGHQHVDRALSLDTHLQYRPARLWYEQTPLQRGDLVFCRQQNWTLYA